jgi:hypothetical protein
MWEAQGSHGCIRKRKYVAEFTPEAMKQSKAKATLLTDLNSKFVVHFKNQFNFGGTRESIIVLPMP